MSNRYSKEAQEQFEAFRKSLADYVTDNGDRIKPTSAEELMTAVGLNAKNFNQQRIRFNRWSEQQSSLSLMLNWHQIADVKDFGYRNDYTVCVIVTAEQFYADRARERFTRANDFYANRVSDVERLHVNAIDNGFDSDKRAAIGLLFNTMAITNKMQKIGYVQDAMMALKTEERDAIDDLTMRFEGVMSMIEVCERNGKLPSMAEIIKITSTSRAVDTMLGLVDASNGEHADD